MSITPDTKDWTWVLDRECHDCGFEASAVPLDKVSGLLLENAARWHSLLRSPGDHAARPAPEKWSPLEYAAHVRDTCRVYLYRLRLMLEQDDPLYPNWDQDATAVEERYDEQDPVDVADELLACAQELAAAFAHVKGDQWQRTGQRSDGAAFTVETFARYFLHDPVHHWWDVQVGAPAEAVAAPEPQEAAPEEPEPQEAAREEAPQEEAEPEETGPEGAGVEAARS